MPFSGHEKQIAASRANGSKFRGPVTAQGKQRSSQNSYSNGLLARTVVLDTEDRGAYAPWKRPA